MRNKIWYVTIDDVDYMAHPSTHWRHQPNLNRLREIAGKSEPRVEVEPMYFTNVSQFVLDDPTLLALFLAGSWPEWITARERPEWAHALERFCAFIRSSIVPMYAACGSHHLVAKAYAG